MYSYMKTSRIINKLAYAKLFLHQQIQKENDKDKTRLLSNALTDTINLINDFKRVNKHNRNMEKFMYNE